MIWSVFIFIGGYCSVQMTALRDIVGIHYFPRVLAIVCLCYGFIGATSVPLAGMLYIKLSMFLNSHFHG